jgi:hypothetical protein
MSKTIVKMLFGSWIYGTNTPASDLDYKALYVPDAKDILLQRVRQTIVESTKVVKTAKNEPGDVDIETFALQQYLKLLMEGQTVAIDMLFTPSSFYQGEPSWEWQEIQANKHRFLHRGYSAFAGYCRQQANKYGIKGSRIAAVRAAIDFLEKKPLESKLFEFKDEVDAFVTGRDHTTITDWRHANGTAEKYLEVCNRKLSFHLPVKHALGPLRKIFDQYGARALQAETNEGCDWKALMHAVRIGRQAKEFLATGHIEFPRKDAAELLQIRTGQLPYAQVADMIEKGLEEMEEASKKSSLPDQPDRGFADDLIRLSYEEAILKEIE